MEKKSTKIWGAGFCSICTKNVINIKVRKIPKIPIAIKALRGIHFGSKLSKNQVFGYD